MSNFDRSYEKISVAEGGYCFVSGDPGGETFRGISRVFHPSWSGWPIVDAAKNSLGYLDTKDDRVKAKNIDSALSGDASMDASVKAFFRAEFWDKAGCDYISNGELAHYIFDSAVNSGIGNAARWLQIALTVLSVDPSGHSRWTCPTIDGSMGPQTQGIAQAADSLGLGGKVLDVMRLTRKSAIITEMLLHPERRNCADGLLFNRA